MKLRWLATILIAGALEATMFAQAYPPQSYSSDPYYGEPTYDDPEGVYAPAPPPPPAYAYGRPIAPGPGYFWVNGYWNWFGGRYVWVNGYWALPPFSGAYWIGPRYAGGRFFLGRWGGYRGPAYRSYYRSGYSYRPSYGYRSGGYRGPRYEYRAGGGREFHESERGRSHGGHRR